MIVVDLSQYQPPMQLLVRTTLECADGKRPLSDMRHVMEYGTLPPTVVPGGSNGKAK